MHFSVFLHLYALIILKKSQSRPIAIIGQMFYGYGEHVLVRIIAYNSKKMIGDK